MNWQLNLAAVWTCAIVQSKKKHPKKKLFGICAHHIPTDFLLIFWCINSNCPKSVKCSYFREQTSPSQDFKSGKISENFFVYFVHSTIKTICTSGHIAWSEPRLNPPPSHCIARYLKNLNWSEKAFSLGNNQLRETHYTIMSVSKRMQVCQL